MNRIPIQREKTAGLYRKKERESTILVDAEYHNRSPKPSISSEARPPSRDGGWWRLMGAASRRLQSSSSMFYWSRRSRSGGRDQYSPVQRRGETGLDHRLPALHWMVLVCTNTLDPYFVTFNLAVTFDQIQREIMLNYLILIDQHILFITIWFNGVPLTSICSSPICN